MAVSASVGVVSSVVETIESNTIGYSDETKRRVTQDSMAQGTVILNASSTPPAAKVATFRKSLSAGAATVDMTSLAGAGANGATVDLTGLKVQVLRLKALATNANPLTVTVGATNGYDLLGAGFNVALKPGQRVDIWGNDLTPDVASGDKTLDLAGTGTESIDIQIIAG